ncbi:hypothetical protein E2C01_052043 [Portunus trituberculatus]|uniref:Uncharacterized protein n=1 Tax=Portunus trituberculatus TaxID=210409 RepID=A0A5B7GCK5_PORTR|nr:hypothetical protein [Portunus trituberculatus]
MLFDSAVVAREEDNEHLASQQHAFSSVVWGLASLFQSSASAPHGRKIKGQTRRGAFLNASSLAPIPRPSAAVVSFRARKGQLDSVSGTEFSRGQSSYGVSMEVTPRSSGFPGEAGPGHLSTLFRGARRHTGKQHWIHPGGRFLLPGCVKRTSPGGWIQIRAGTAQCSGGRPQSQVCGVRVDSTSSIALQWHQADLFPLLLSLLVDHPRVLPPWASVLHQPHCHLFNKSPGALHLHAWRLSSIFSKREAFHGSLLDLWPIQSDSRSSVVDHLLAEVANCMGFQQRFITLRQ